MWTQARQAEFDGLEAARIFPEIPQIPEGSNIVDLKWLLKWKGYEHLGMIDKSQGEIGRQGL